MTRKTLIQTIATEYDRNPLATLQALHAALENIADFHGASAEDADKHFVGIVEDASKAIEDAIDLREGGNPAFRI
jgi:hypothetical protein